MADWLATLVASRPRDQARLLGLVLVGWQQSLSQYLDFFKEVCTRTRPSREVVQAFLEGCADLGRSAQAHGQSGLSLLQFLAESPGSSRAGACPESASLFFAALEAEAKEGHYQSLAALLFPE